jgi:hypothetical protein
VDRLIALERAIHFSLEGEYGGSDTGTHGMSESLSIDRAGRVAAGANRRPRYRR